jgi:hypothetical protein
MHIYCRCVCSLLLVSTIIVSKLASRAPASGSGHAASQ